MLMLGLERGGGMVAGGEVRLAKRANWQATGVRRFFAERKSRMVLIVAKKGNLLAWRVGGWFKI